MSTTTTEFILQWNTRSLISHWGEFKHYILNNNPVAAAIQETHFHDMDFTNYTLKVPGYSLYANNINIQPRQGGTALLISNNILHHQIDLQTTLDAVGVNIKIGQHEITLLSIYLSPSAALDTNSISQLFNSINTPCLIMGDFNSHHQAWGCNANTTRGRNILNLLEEHNLVFLNDQTPTHLTHRGGQLSYSAIDLALSSANIAPLFKFNVQSDPLFSDHYPIHIELEFPSGQTNFNFLPRWNIRKADWTSFQNHIDAKHPPNSQPNIESFLNAILASAHENIPHTRQSQGRKTSPWWNTECQRAVALRKRALRQFQRCICEAHDIEVRRTRTEAHDIITKAKKESWQNFSSEFNRFTPLSKIWSLLKTFCNKRSTYKIPHLNINNNMHLLPERVVAEFAKHYTDISSTHQYTPLLTNRIHNQLQTLSFDSTNLESYNALFTELELTHAIGKCGQTSVGPDQIDYSFFKNLSKTGLTNLLTAYNSLWVAGTFPNSWSASTLIPILKPGKPSSSPSSYRPISLTSCACKLLERMINNRMRTYLETHHILSQYQNGFRPGRSTADNLVRLIDAVQTGFQQKEVTVALFLDLKAAFDKVNKKALLIKLHQAGFRGRLAKFIINFLENRTIKVRCGNTLSPSFIQDHGLPQGSVISPTLFLIMINDVFKDIEYISPQIQFSMYADDLMLWYTYPSVDHANRTIQQALLHVNAWCENWGLVISPNKSKSLIFTKKPHNVPPLIPLRLNNQTIPVVTTFKYLGITLDSRLNFIEHFNDITQRCTRRINIMRALSGRKWGADRSTLLKMYTSIIRPILDYNAFLFDGISSVKVKNLQTIQNTALRVVTGALRTTNTYNLHVDTNIPTLTLRRKYQLLRFYARANSHPSHPTHHIVHAPQPNRLLKRHTIYPRISRRIIQTLELFNIPHLNTMPAAPLTPYWLDTQPTTHHLFTTNKTSVTTAETHALFHEFKAEHPTHTFIYTDGSRDNEHTGGAFTLFNNNKTFRLPDINSVYTAELTAILVALTYAKSKGLKEFVICTDSSSSLSAISSIREYCNPIIYGIRKLFKYFNNQHISTKLLWIPGHADIRGNEEADKLAKASLQLPAKNHLSSPLPDVLNFIYSQFILLRQREWDATRHYHLHPIKPSITHFPSSHQDCREKEVILARLRVGHTILTHSHIMDSLPPPTCQHCPGDIRYTIEHFLIHCPKHNSKRQQIIHYTQTNNITLNLPTLLGDSHPELIKLLFNFLRDTKLDRSI
jgi:ribonuclease HI/exonuclease III